MISQTSLLAFDSISDSLGSRQLQVLKVFRDQPLKSFSNMELSLFLGLPINRITPRVLELRKMGYIVADIVKPCFYTGRMVTFWRLRL